MRVCDTSNDRVTEINIPRESRVVDIYSATNLADAYSVDLPDGAARDPEILARFLFAHQPRWIDVVMKVRDVLVSGFGLKTATQLHRKDDHADVKRIGIFRIYESHPTEIVLGEDDKHLDFRLSVLRQPAMAERSAELVISTVVSCHNRLGRTYIKLIAPFHRLVVQSILRRAARVGWPDRISTSTPIGMANV